MIEYINSTKKQTRERSIEKIVSEIKLKIADFGLSKAQEFPFEKMTKEIMTLWYRAPEVILNNLNYTPAIDYWSVGLIIFDMLIGESMFCGCSEIEMLFKIFNLKGTPVSE